MRNTNRKQVENTYCKFRIQYEASTGDYGHDLPLPLQYWPMSEYVHSFPFKWSLQESWSLALHMKVTMSFYFLTILTHTYSDSLTENTISIQSRITYMVLVCGGWVSFWSVFVDWSFFALTYSYKYLQSPSIQFIQCFQFFRDEIYYWILRNSCRCISTKLR